MARLAVHMKIPNVLATGLLLASIAFSGVAAAAGAAAPGPGSFPDWAGLWQNVTGIHIDRAVSPNAPPEVKKVYVPVDPPYKGEYAERWKQVQASFARGEPVNDPTAACVWPGVPRVIWNPYPKEFVFSDDGKMVVILEEYMSQVRRVHTDGRGHPEDIEPSFNGHSIGHWEGQVLVIDTVGLREDTMLQNTGMMHSDQLRVQERWHLITPDLLQADVTLIDPVAFSHPITTHRVFRRQRDWAMVDYVCSENNRELVVDGVTTHAPAAE